MINDLAFSADTQHVAFGSTKGTLRVCRNSDGRQLLAAASFFGEIFCVSWSPDGKLVLAGGQDDLISIFAIEHT